MGACRGIVILGAAALAAVKAVPALGRLQFWGAITLLFKPVYVRVRWLVPANEGLSALNLLPRRSKDVCDISGLDQIV